MILQEFFWSNIHDCITVTRQTYIVHHNKIAWINNEYLVKRKMW